MEKILEYNKKILRVEFNPSIIDSFFGSNYKVTEYVNIGTNLFSQIKWIDKKTGELRIDENFDNYVKAQEIIKEANN